MLCHLHAPLSTTLPPSLPHCLHSSLLQPMDAGVIAMMKAMLRDFYAKWAIHSVQSFMSTGGDPAEFKLPLGKQDATRNLVKWMCSMFNLMVAENEKVVHCWDKTGLLGAWLQSNQILAVSRAAELFPNLDHARRGHDEDPLGDPEPDTDVGAPIDQPDDLPVLLPSGAVHRSAANNDTEAADLLMAAGWIDWDAAAGV